MCKRYDDLIEKGVRVIVVEGLAEGIVWCSSADLMFVDKNVGMPRFLKACDRILLELEIRAIRPLGA